MLDNHDMLAKSVEVVRGEMVDSMAIIATRTVRSEDNWRSINPNERDKTLNTVPEIAITVPSNQYHVA